MKTFYWHEITNELSLINQTQGLGTGVGRGLGVGPDLGVGVGRGVAVAVAVGVAVVLAVGVAVGVAVEVAVAVAVAVGVAVAVVVAVAVGEAVAVGVGIPPMYVTASTGGLVLSRVSNRLAVRFVDSSPNISQPKLLAGLSNQPCTSATICAELHVY